MKFFFTCLLLFVIASHCFSQTIDKDKIKAFVDHWNNAHTERNFSLLQKLYGQNIIYYGQPFSVQELLKKKTDLLASPSYLEQKNISKRIFIQRQSDNKIKCSFDKQVVYVDKIKTYPFYLILQSKNDGYVIVGESDKLTDARLSAALGESRSSLGDIKQAIILNRSTLVISGVGLVALLFIALAIRTIIQEKKITHKELLTPSSSSRHFAPVNYDLSEDPIVRKLIDKIKVIPLEVNFQHQANFSTETITKEQIQSSVEKGRDFENYSVDKFDLNYFMFKDWRSDKYINGKYPESNRAPDLLFALRHKDGLKEFLVECKYRSKLFRGGFVFDGMQLRHYQIFEDKGTDVYLFLGLDGSARAPSQIFLIPLKECKNLLKRLEKSKDAKEPYLLHIDKLLNYKQDRKNVFYMDRDRLILTMEK